MLDSVLTICCIWYNVIKSENLRFEYYKTKRQLKAVFELISLIHSWHLFQFMIDFLGNVKLLSNIFEKWWMKKKNCFLEREWSNIPNTWWSDDEETENTPRDIARVRLLIPHYHKKRSSSLYCVTTVVIGAETSIHQEPTHLMAQRNKWFFHKECLKNNFWDSIRPVLHFGSSFT